MANHTLYAADIETTGLLHDMKKQPNPKLHNLGLKSIADGSEECLHGTDKQAVQKKLDSGITLIMHNGKLFDMPALEMLGYDVSKVKLVDTLALSWYLEPKRKKHGLAEWGEEFGVPKPVIENWENLTQEEYDHRVMQDVRIQTKLWHYLWNKLKAIYGSEKECWRIIDFLNFKMDIQRVQQDTRWKLDVQGAEKLLVVLEEAVKERTDALAKAMPRVAVRALKSRPPKPFKKDGSLSVAGKAWEELTLSHGLDFEHQESIAVIKKWNEPNPGSHIQVKDWLNKLGWKPETFKFKRDKVTGDTSQIPQTSIGDGKVCPSITKLMKKEPSLSALEGLGIAKHRLSMVKGFLRDADSEGYLVARCNGFTNTLRLKHSCLVNLPSGRVPYGKEIRGLLIQEEGFESLGADLSSLEDRCKHHFQMPYDPDYVKQQMAGDFDPHLLICGIAGLLTEQQIADHKAGVADYSDIRHLGKGTNYSLIRRI